MTELNLLHYNKGTLVNMIKKLEEKNERLNNIINELEKWLDEEYDYLDKYGYPAGVGYAMGQIRRTKDKLKELKENRI